MIDNNTKQIAIITSIAPKGIENQKAAIDSWVSAGFKVISFNCKEEIKLIRPFFPEVEFMAAQRDARKKFGKPYVYVTDIMDAFLCLPYEACGIINSDIHIKNLDNELYRYIVEQSKGSIVFAQRTDIDTVEDTSGSLCVGYDCFFFDREMARIFKDEDFCIGQPAWDYWVIIMAALNNVVVKKLLNPIAYHIRHALNWDVKTGSNFKKQIFDKYINASGKYLGNHPNAMDREYGRLVFHSHEEILYSGSDREPSVLVVCSVAENIEISDTAVYKSIIGQKYENYRVIMGKREDIDISGVPEEFIYFITEGSMAGRNFLAMMVDSTKEYDCSICGLKIINNQNLAVTYSYPVQGFDGQQACGQFIDDYILYRTKSLRTLGDIRKNSQGYRINYVAEGLVESVANKATVLFSEEKYGELIEKYEVCNLPEVLYYRGISYLKKNRFDEGLNCLLEFFDSVNDSSNKNKLPDKNAFYMTIFDEIAAGVIPDSDKETMLWKKLQKICLYEASVRYRILFLLYKYKSYGKIISLSEINSSETNFYIGRVYKDLEDYEKSILFLSRYIDFVEKYDGNQLTPVYGNDFLVSAYFHLGEIYYHKGEASNAKRFFEKCIDNSHNKHLKAEEYLKNLQGTKEKA